MVDASRLTRRALLRSTGRLAGAALVLRYAPGDLGAAQPPAATQAGIDALTARRTDLAKAAIARAPLSERVVLLSGPGGNVVVLHGPDGLLLVDNFVRPAWPQLKTALEAIGGPVRTAIDTHWHFDHADNNASLRKAGAAVVAHQNTRKRLGEPHDVLGLHMDPEPPEALPTDTFTDARTMQANGETVTLQALPPAHTDGDIYIRFEKANVLHLGDVFFNGSYPFIDASTGGHLGGMITAAERGLAVADARTKIVPGHGPLADRPALERYRTMLATVRDRVSALKSAGKSIADVQAAKPTEAFDAEWGKGFIKPADFVALAYDTIR